jgi:hypothetical protein
MPIPMMPMPWMMMYPPVPMSPMFMPYMPMPMMSMPFAPMPWTMFPSNNADSSQVRNENNRSELNDTDTSTAAHLLLSLSKHSEDISPTPNREQEQPMQRIIPEKEKNISSSTSASSTQVSPYLDFEYGTARDRQGDLVPEKIIIKKQKLSEATGAPVGNTLVRPTSICLKSRRRYRSIQIFNKALQFIKICASLGSTPSWKNYAVALKKLQCLEGGLNRDTIRKGKQLILFLQATLKKEAEMGRELSKEECRQFVKENKKEVIGVKKVKISFKDFPDFVAEARKHVNELLVFQIPDTERQ